MDRLGDAGVWVVVPEVTDYEVRRELLRLGDARSVDRLDTMRQLGYEPITTPIMRRAAQLWAELRRQGRPLADRHALDADVILAATALELVERGHEVMVATSNQRHLEGLVPSARWEDLTY